MNTGEIAKVAVEKTFNMTWKNVIVGAVGAAAHAGFVALSVMVAIPTSFDLYTRAGLIAVAKVFGTGAFGGVVLYLTGLFQKAPAKPWDGSERRVESDTPQAPRAGAA